MSKCFEECENSNENKSDLEIVLSELYKERYNEDLPSNDSTKTFLDGFQGNFYVDVFEDEKEYAYYISGLDIETSGYDPEIIKDTFGVISKEAIERLVMFFYKNRTHNSKKPIDSQEYLHESENGEFYLVSCSSDMTLDDLIYEARKFLKYIQ